MHNSSPHSEIVTFLNSDDINAQIEDVFELIARRLHSLLKHPKIVHIGSTAIPNSLTKGDLDVLCLVEDHAFDEAKQILSKHFSSNLGTEDMQGFSSFECSDYEISTGIQLMSRSASQPPFLLWREWLLSDSAVRNEYDDMKRDFNGKSMHLYREAKEVLISKYCPDENSNEYDVFAKIKQQIERIRSKKNKPLRVAINGIEGTGKTIFTKKLTRYLNSKELKAIHISIDGFHFNKAHRYRQGPNSAIGYYQDSYNEQAFIDKVLISSQKERPDYTPATHDLISDEYLEIKPIDLPSNAVLITDGAYLFKPIYRKHWDLKIYLKTDYQIALQRGIQRDKEHLNGYESAKDKFIKRYHAASHIYINQCMPEEQADIIIDNTKFNKLRIVKIDT